MSKWEFPLYLDKEKKENPDSPVWNRSIRSLCFEWATHNVLYALGIRRSKTADVDFEYPQKWYLRFCYSVIGFLVFPFIE